MTVTQLQSDARPAGRIVGEHLKSLRHQRGLTLEQVGARLGWSATRVSRIENNTVRMPEPKDLRRLADIYDVSPLEILIAAGYVDSNSNGKHS